jgi:hypothetical protein
LTTAPELPVARFLPVDFKDIFLGDRAMRIFLAGIMQGSHVAALVHDQTYRNTLRDLVQAHWPEAEVYDPFANHATSVGYDMRRAREVFMGHIEICREFDLIVAYVPEASMGTAIEVWEAHRHGRRVVTITPLTHNWVVQITSDAIYRDADEFAHGLRSGAIDRLLEPRP